MDGLWYWRRAVLHFTLNLERKCGGLALWSRAHVYNDVLTLIQWDGCLDMLSCLDCSTSSGICSIEATCSSFRYFFKNYNILYSNVMMFKFSFVMIFCFAMQPVTFCAVWYSWLCMWPLCLAGFGVIHVMAASFPIFEKYYWYVLFKLLELHLFYFIRFLSSFYKLPLHVDSSGLLFCYSLLFIYLLAFIPFLWDVADRKRPSCNIIVTEKDF